MRRRTMLIALGILLGFAGILTLSAGFLLRHTPTFYRAALRAPGPERQKHSKEFVAQSSPMFSAVADRSAEGWGGVFTNEQINCYLQEDFIRGAGGDKNLPDHCHDLRVSVEEDRLRLGFRYGTGFFSTIISIDLKIWLVANETNLIAVEVVRLRAGGMPISPQFFLDRIREIARRENIEVKWYRRDGHPVAMLRLQAYQRQPSIHLQQLRLQQGQIVIFGRSVEPFSGGVRETAKRGP